MPLKSGQDLLHYRLVEKIGEGGMGVVWRATDTTLDRQVAIKVLPAEFATDPERVGRFAREAKLLATLSHPNIASVYGLHEAELAAPEPSVRFIAMELVEGEDLAQRLERGPLLPEDAVLVARQVAEALEAAHEQGVIHRDLKPANVKRAPDGQIKVLDLGLAKAMAVETSNDDVRLSFSPTLTSAGTVAGTLLGTAAYMSPEQAKGQAADRRADIWAFGCLLYEMLAGRKAFGGETVSETLASVLRDEVDWSALPDATPASVTRLLRRCLDRDVRNRLRDIGEARIALSTSDLGEVEDLGGETVAHPRGRERLAWTVAVLAMLTSAVLGWWALQRPQPPVPNEVRASIRPPKGQLFEAYGVHAGAVSVSPDGRHLTFVSGSGEGRPTIFVRSLGSEVARQLPDTEGGAYPFWSPDSRHLAFFVGGKLKKIDLTGGAPMTICDAPSGRGGSWNTEGVILFAPDTQSPIHRVSAAGGSAIPVTTLDLSRQGESTHRYPVFLPDGRHFLYLRASHSSAPVDEVNSIWIASIDSEETFELMQSQSNALYGRGHIFWARDRFLMARPFDLDELAFSGDAIAVGEELVVQPTYWRGAFGVSRDGLIAFQGGLGSDQHLAWFDREGNELASIGSSGRFDTARLSPDGDRLAVTILDSSGGRGDLWLHDLDRNVGSRLTFDDGHDKNPVWSSDGSRVAFVSSRAGSGGDIYVRPADGRGDVELLYASEALDTPQDWSPDGRFLAIDKGLGRNDLWIVPTDGSEAYSFVATDFDEGYARFSPDGEWLAYVSNESGRYELYLTRFPSGDGKWQLSTAGADWLVGWRQDGDELYYLDLEGALTAVGVQLGERVEAELPVTLFSTRADTTWDSASDGERFVLAAPDDPNEAYPITLVLNWQGAR